AAHRPKVVRMVMSAENVGDRCENGSPRKAYSDTIPTREAASDPPTPTLGGNSTISMRHRNAEGARPSPRRAYTMVNTARPTLASRAGATDRQNRGTTLGAMKAPGRQRIGGIDTTRGPRSATWPRAALGLLPEGGVGRLLSPGMVARPPDSEIVGAVEGNGEGFDI